MYRYVGPKISVTTLTELCQISINIVAAPICHICVENVHLAFLFPLWRLKNENSIILYNDYLVFASRYSMNTQGQV